MRYFFRELHRRRVLRVAAAYAVIAFVVINISIGASAYYDWPPAAVTAVIAGAAVLFPLAVVAAWFFDYTPWGILKTPPKGELPHIPTGLVDYRVEAVIIFFLLILLGISVRGMFEDFAAQEAAAQPSPGLHDLE